MGSTNIEKELDEMISENVWCHREFDQVINELSKLSNDKCSQIKFRSVACKISVSRVADSLRKSLESLQKSVEQKDDCCSNHSKQKMS